MFGIHTEPLRVGMSDREISCWAWESQPRSFERAFSSLSTSDAPAASQQAPPSLVVCTSSGLLWRVTIIAHGPDGNEWKALTEVCTCARGALTAMLHLLDIESVNLHPSCLRADAFMTFAAEFGTRCSAQCCRQASRGHTNAQIWACRQESFQRADVLDAQQFFTKCWREGQLHDVPYDGTAWFLL